MCHVDTFWVTRRPQWPTPRDVRRPASGARARDGDGVVVVRVVVRVVACARPRHIGDARDRRAGDASAAMGEKVSTARGRVVVVVVVIVGAPDARARDHARGVRGGRARGRGGVGAGDECVRRGGERVGREGVGARVAGARGATRVRVREGWVWGGCGVCVRGE